MFAILPLVRSTGILDCAMSVLLDENGIAAALDRMAGEIARSIPRGVQVGVIGIRSRGDTLAARLMQSLESRKIGRIEFGTLDITLYRDDLAEIGPAAVVRTTEIPFDVADKYLVLVDDVIFTGRSIRAALDAISDLGRPRSIRLAVLVDRGGRELPIQPDFVGIKADGDDRHITVMLKESSGLDRVEIDG